MSNHQKRILGVGLAAPLVALLIFGLFVYFQDTWERDNFSLLADYCKNVEVELNKPRDNNSLIDCYVLVAFVGRRELREPYFLDMLAKARLAIKEKEDGEAKAEAEKERINRAEAFSRQLEKNLAEKKFKQDNRSRDITIARYMHRRWIYYEKRDGGHYPERHDPLVFKDASLEFGITPQEAKNAFNRAPDIDWTKRGMPVAE